MARVGSGRRRRRIGRRREAAKPLEFDDREIADVHVHEQFPLFFRSPLRDDAAIGVTDRAGRAHALVRDGLIEHAVFSVIHRRFGLFRRKAVLVAQIFDDGAGLVRRQRQTVQPNHALDRLLPAFGRQPLVGDARQVAFLVALVAAGAFLDREFIGDGNAFLSRIFWLFRRLVLGSRLGLGPD